MSVFSPIALLLLLQSGNQTFLDAFQEGNDLFETFFNAAQGVGAKVRGNERFTRIPRADLTGPGEWANHTPSRATGPNAQSCTSCHNIVGDDGPGTIAGNVHRDPLHTGQLGSMIQRNTPHLFGAGAVQKLATEMTKALRAIRDGAVSQVCGSGGSVTVALVAKGVNFGTLKVTRTGTNPCVTTFDTSGVQGIAADLIVRPFQWKGSVAFLRDFNRGACHNELGMQAEELVGTGVDGDGDGVINEMSVEDQTNLAVYIAAQPRPTTRVELASLGLIPALSSQETTAINQGSTLFNSVGCAVCHVKLIQLNSRTFQEPSSDPDYRDAVFPSGANPLSFGLDPNHPVQFDLTKDQPDNHVPIGTFGSFFNLGALKVDSQGKAIVEMFGDLKRHDMGPGLAEAIDEVGTGASNFLTENLWGVGSTAPYLHDGRASTLQEAILAHGGEAAASQAAFAALSSGQKSNLIAYLNNLVLFKLPEAGE